MKLSIDGAVVAKNRFAVAGCIKIYDTDSLGRPIEFTHIPHLLDEMPIFYYFGKRSNWVECKRKTAQIYIITSDLKKENNISVSRHEGDKITGEEKFDVLKKEARASFDDLKDLELNGYQNSDVEVILTCDWKAFGTILGKLHRWICWAAGINQHK